MNWETFNEDVVDHESNCAACGVFPRFKHHRHCKDCHDELTEDRTATAGKAVSKPTDK